MEMKIRQYLTVASAPTMSAGFISTMTAGILSDEDVLFNWTIVAAEWEEETEKALLKQICNLWIAIRGFSFASSWLEMYKQTEKKTVQKSKGVRQIKVDITVLLSFQSYMYIFYNVTYNYHHHVMKWWYGKHILERINMHARDMVTRNVIVTSLTFSLSFRQSSVLRLANTHIQGPFVPSTVASCHPPAKELTTRSTCVFLGNSDTLGLSWGPPFCVWHPKIYPEGLGILDCSGML